MTEGCREDERPRVAHPLSSLTKRGGALLFAALTFCLFVVEASAQKRPKPALKESDARRAIAETQGFVLRTSAVKIKEVSPVGASPVRVSAGVTIAFRLVRVEDERMAQTGGIFKIKRWRAVEFRTGDRTWEEFDLVADGAGSERVEAARRALEELVTEFEEQLIKQQKSEAEKAATPEPLTRGPLTIKQLSPMGASAVAEVEVNADFNLVRDARGKWRVTNVEVGGESFGDFEAFWRTANTRKAARAQRDLAEMREALEAFRRERGFYVVAEDSIVLQDHLSPRYARRIIRLDPWHNPYRYAGTQASYTLASDGPDGKPDTADDVTEIVNRKP